MIRVVGHAQVREMDAVHKVFGGSHALGREVRNRTHLTNKELEPRVKALVSAGLIRTGQTINDTYYEPIEENLL